MKQATILGFFIPIALFISMIAITLSASKGDYHLAIINLFCFLWLIRSFADLIDAYVTYQKSYEKLKMEYEDLL